MFQINETRILIGAKDGFDSKCYYLITIKTSCDSPTYTKDEISLLLGDGFGAEVLYYIYKSKN
jgi:hypothetical protein